MRYFLPLIFLISACTNVQDESQTSDNQQIIAVVEIPAGTNKKIEYNYHTESFEVDINDGVERIIRYLPYPANYGFIENTLMDKASGGDGDALDVLVICEALPTGTRTPVIPIGTLSLIDEGEVDDKVIAVPADAELNILGVAKWADFLQKCPDCENMIKSWFLNYSRDDMVFQGWYDETKTRAEINRWKVN